MSNLHLSVYLNEDRPQVLHPSVTELPLDALGPELCARLKDSLAVDSSDGVACAASARLWECLLEKTRLPYLLLRVADMRMSLGSKVTAVMLYVELQAILRDPTFSLWVAQSRSSILAEADRQLIEYKNNPSLGFSPSQRWRSTAGIDTFPYCRLQQAQITSMRDDWLRMDSPMDIKAKFFNLHCLETNVIEGTVQFDESTTTQMVQLGFYNQAEPLDAENLIRGAVRDRADAISILQDTHKALNEIFAILQSEPINLTVELVRRLHAQLMKTSRVLYVDTNRGRRLSYLNVGVTRQISRVNVTATLKSVKIQFCPSDEVETELSIFCRRFNELVQNSNMDPFAAAAWISHIFITIHPFEASSSSTYYERISSNILMCFYIGW
ncbi:hypothetical protein BDN70DRAFT_932772 [Pholiota conissans]|uniref:Fido domain-containing protein n=1 Tax=Pholiota conissans TaxID=109636 RepID=A0A9P6D0C6_9AGAR|nr:hypothetical protein BDN70DRAFT_932772 [Pholiota conissans]